VDDIEVVVVGAGVIGLAVARALARDGREVVILEASEGIGNETSSRNSEVIHAGIYYPRGSLKAELCVRGKALLYEFLNARGLPHARCGKLIVATSAEQNAELEAIRARAAANGANDLELLSAARARSLEPELACTAALLSPSTGILDSHSYMLALLADAEGGQAVLALRSRLARAHATPAGLRLLVDGAESIEVRARILVNCAGLHASSVARCIEGLPPQHIPPTYLCKGNYYALARAAPFKRLIYPVPERAGLGVHLTLDLAGQARFGPDVEWIERIDYSVDPARAQRFYAEVRKYWPGLRDGELSPGYCGIRPKLEPASGPASDFIIQGPREHGVRGLVNLFGIESPGLTASLAIAERVQQELQSTDA
jgi:L-2-hydroxyglutarate oxidase LhgO